MLDHEQFPFEFHTTLSRARDIILEHGPKGGEAATLWPEHKRVADQLAVLSIATEEALYHGWAVNNFSHLLADTHCILNNIARQTPDLHEADLAIIENMRQVHSQLPAVTPAIDLQIEIAQSQAGRLQAESTALLGSNPPFPYLEFGKQYQVEGDPETAEHFARTLNYLKTITAHFIEFGPWQEKTSADLADELEYHNAWGEHEAGKSGKQYQEVTPQHLQALSRRRMLTFEEAGNQVDLQTYQAARHIDALISEAIASEKQIRQFSELDQEQKDLFIATLPTR